MTFAMVVGIIGTDRYINYSFLIPNFKKSSALKGYNNDKIQIYGAMPFRLGKDPLV